MGSDTQGLKITVSADSVENILRQMAEQMQSEVLQSQNEYIFEIPKAMGSGYVRGADFPFGVTVIELNVLAFQPFSIRCGQKSEYLLKFIFNLQNAIKYGHGVKRQAETVNRYDSLLVGNQFSTSDYFIPSNEPVSVFLILLNEGFIDKKMIRLDLSGDGATSAITTLNEEASSIYYRGGMALSIAELITSYKNNEYDSVIKYLFREAKITEIISEGFRWYLYRDIDKNNNSLRLKVLYAVRNAALIISQELPDLISVANLAERVGVTPAVLQRGFRKQFNCSVNDYIANVRLRKAEELLSSSQLSISEITYEIGISSKSYFSKLFKDRYGISPSVYKKKMINREVS